MHLHGLQLPALIVVLAIASSACACSHHQFGCYGSCTGAASCEGSGGGCQCVGPPTPSPPLNSWRCINGQCQNVPGGIDKGSCLSACDPSKDLYKCINNTCVKNGTGVIKSVCGAVCGRNAAQAVLHGGVSATNATIAGGLFGEGVKALGEDEWAAHDWTTNNQTQYLIATRDDTCVQIPVVMKNESIFCHGPFPRAEIRSGFLQDWVAGKGSCKEQGPGALSAHSVLRILTCDPCAF